MPGAGLGSWLPAEKRHRLDLGPTTRPGRWAVILAVASVVSLGSWRLMGPLGGFPALVFGLAGGVFALVAIFGRAERALSVFAALVPFAGTVVALVAELLVDH